MLALSGAGLCAVAFVALMLAVRGVGPVVVLDGLVQAGLAPLRVRPVLAGFDWLTQMGTGGAGAGVLLASTGLLAATGRGGVVAPMWLAFLGAEATSWSVKFVAGRARPPFLDGITAGSPSFPSAHATVAVAVYGFLALAAAAMAPTPMRPGLLAAGGMLIALIAFSRLVLSLHYLSDVVGGLLVGVAWLCLAWRLMPAGS